MPREVVEAPITGIVLQVNTSNGSQIKEGESICVLESMKMEIPIAAPVSGKISEIKVSPGGFAQTGAELAVIEY